MRRILRAYRSARWRAAPRAGFVDRFNLAAFQELGNGQAYFEAVSDIAEDEALIIESDLADSRPFWNVQASDALWNQIEYVYRRFSLNGLRATSTMQRRRRWPTR